LRQEPEVKTAAGRDPASAAPVHQPAEAPVGLDAQFCDDVERINLDKRYIGQEFRPRKIVPPHYSAVMIEPWTNKPAGFIAHSKIVVSVLPRKVIRLIPNRLFERTCATAIETRDGLFTNLRFGVSFSYQRPDTFFFKFPQAFCAAHRRVSALVELALLEGLSTSVRARTYDELRSVPAQSLAQEILDRLHTEPDGKTRRSARQSLLDEFGAGNVRFWIAELLPTPAMREASEAATRHKLEAEAEIHAEEAREALQLHEDQASLAMFESAGLAPEQAARMYLDRLVALKLAPNGRLFAGHLSLPANDAAATLANGLEHGLRSLAAAPDTIEGGRVLTHRALRALRRGSFSAVPFEASGIGNRAPTMDHQWVAPRTLSLGRSSARSGSGGLRYRAR
jgi:hypothetical protein